MKGLIMIGYPGIGKSSIAGKENCIDLESGNFWINNSRSPDWYIPYCQIALSLADQGFTVLTSSHRKVRTTFELMPIPSNVGRIVIFCPPTSMRSEWLKRLGDRYERTKSLKDLRALRNAVDNYCDNISEFYDSKMPIYNPDTINYDLMDYVKKARKDWCE